MLKPVSMILLLLPLFSAAQTSFLQQASVRLEKALIDKDTTVLKQLLHKDATYGHSNGWVETKADVINDLVTGKLTYKKVTSTEPRWSINNNVATLRNTADISFELDHKPAELHLHVLQVWLKTNKGWQLLTRQSTKL